MPTEIGELRARLTAEAQEIKAEIRATKQGFADLGEQGKKTAGDIGTLNTALGRVGENKDQINRLTSVLENVNAKIEIQRKKLAELKQAYDSTFDNAKKGKLQEQIVNTEGVLIRLTQTSDQTAQKIWALEDSLDQAGVGGQQVATQLNTLDDALKGIGLSADQIKTIKKNLDEADPTKLDRQLDELSSALKGLGVDSKQIEKITNELRESEQEAQKTKQGISGIASGLASLGAGAVTAKLTNVMKSLANETNQLANSYRGLSSVSEKFNVDSQESVELAEKLADRWGLNKGVIADTVKTYTTLNFSLEETEKIITATADAAAYGRQAHLSWDQAIKQVAEGIKAGNSNLTDAAGVTTNLSVMQDRYAKSIGTTAAKLTEAQKVQAAYNGMMQEASVFAGNADSAMTGYTGTQATFNQTLEMARVELGEAFLPVLQEVMEEIVPMVKEFTAWSTENKDVVAGVAAATVTLGGLITVVTSLITVVAALRAAFTALNISMGPIGWAIAAFSAVTVGVTAYTAAASAASKEVLQLASSQEELNKKLNESPANRNVNELKQMKEDSEAINTILEERAGLQEKLDELYKKMRSNFDGGPELHNLQRSIGELDKKLKDMDFKNVDEATAALNRMREEIDKSVPALLEMQKAELRDLATKNDKIIALEKSVDRYNELAAVQKLDEAQKQELVQVTNALKEQYPDLHALMDDEGRIRIENIGTIEDQISVERQLLDSSINTAKVQILNLQETARVQKVSVEAQIKNYQALIQAAKAAAAAQSSSNPMEAGDKSWLEQINPGVVNWARNKGAETEQKLSQAYEDQNKFAAAELEAKRALARLESGGIDSFKYQAPDYGGGSDAEKKKGQKSKTAAELRKDAYDAAIATVQYQAEMYDWTADEQIKSYEKVRKQHQKHLKESLEDERQMNLQIKRLQEDSVRSRYDFSAEWIDREDRRMEESGNTEIEIAQMKIDAWTRVRDRYAEDSEFYKDADDKLYQYRKELISATEKAMKELYSSTSDFLKYEERRLEEAGASEAEIAQMKLALWTRIRDSYAEDSEYYKQADEQVYQAKKNLVSQIQKDNEAARKVEKQSINDAKKLELDAIAERKKAYTDDIDERIAAIDRLIKAEERLNSEQDYASQLAEKKARQALLENAVSPEGRKEYADITKEIERMELEHSRDIRKQNLEDQKEALQDEKSERERAFDKEKEDVEKHYNALTDALENYQDDVKLMEVGLQDYRVGANQTANTQILADLDSFVSAYNSKLASLTSASGPSQQANDLQEYNSNKDAWDEAKARGDKEAMAKLTARNDEIRRKYGIEKDTGKLDNLPSYDVGGVIPGPIGVPVPIVAHGGEIYLNPEQQTNLFRMLDSPKTTSGAGQAPVQPQQIIHNTFDMSVGSVTIEDQPDAEIMYTERERAARRLMTTGEGK
ncbi:hypothetical protein [Paenibacillus brevis]|uniref:Phage tail tape measure protein n=1 Tax=Paenibacillus brevis TaxID=2841508 RepID=A0ABS6FSP2_9BACL|nr:hypothetical protein [Paenibacillus brevis]MBU5673250.1 hypothetical protein [Paenibacillus brevis]